MNTYLDRLPHVLQNVDALLRDRGFGGHPRAAARPDAEALVTAALAARCSIGALLTCTLRHETDVSRTLGVAFLDPVFDATKAREIMTSGYQLQGAQSKAQSAGATETLIVTFPRLSPDALKLAHSMSSVQVMNFSRLALRLSGHVLVPRHTPLGEAEAAQLERDKKIVRAQLPALRATDAMVEWHAWPADTVVRIDRPQGPVWRIVKC